MHDILQFFKLLKMEKGKEDIMPKVELFTEELNNIPWQEKPEGFEGPVWRYSENPIIKRNPTKEIGRIFNSAVIPYEGAFIGVFRAEKADGIPMLYLGRSEDAIHWRFEEESIPFVDPSIVRYRCGTYLLTPEEWYEERGFVPNVVFPCATLQDKKTGRIAIYYGAADSYVGLAFTTADEIVTYIKENDAKSQGDDTIGISKR